MRQSIGTLPFQEKKPKPKRRTSQIRKFEDLRAEAVTKIELSLNVFFLPAIDC